MNNKNNPLSFESVLIVIFKLWVVIKYVIILHYLSVTGINTFFHRSVYYVFFIFQST